MGFLSSTLSVPETASIPRHVAIVMDGNGRWATSRKLPRVAGHKRGVDAVREAVTACAELGVEYLTLFAFSSENWRRPQDEVSTLMQLFILALEREVGKLHNNGIRLRVVGALEAFEPRIQELVRRAEERTKDNKGLTLTIAANYGGRWDILQAARKLAAARVAQGGAAALETSFAEEDLAPYLSMAYAPEPDLFIRTGGDQRISNFLLWQLAYTELYFTEEFWPDFNANTLKRAVAEFQQRERRFGRTSAQVQNPSGQSA
ncbi:MULTISPECIES: polyprenyl diphosphate synthase [Pandoraea]|jgi:undecaprenyl diphosphate synthase|uniref:Isoprenyl transferase n=1 Tax=Pandoraea pnomenusa TaxID=93220 RepID=A0A378YCW3_9BURK|nr:MULTISPECIES: polyprenyl diphosphate synthase [Pandoraea]AHB06183.1 UDP diphosphate synthase [Pandoraea pnomenusa 3kgm]AHB77769.1 di-trans,poly-cis-decaprenylcistransferase [Pandoraea pnomenusa]AHN73942.1 di-trans,poly-cis-decaprenylcistransferase [Pandoraea pnomenusa]AIU25323.1 UDP diphosphate synthase [Pandoraea pnomenusa]ANC46440.1 di-trans,poly-cis-decaprenylcistransferase [Pandoraea pnomenusa]